MYEKPINSIVRWRVRSHRDTRGDLFVADIKPWSRIESIDLLRGIVMIIMAIDHVRDFFHFDAFLYSPEDINQTSAGLFFTRWATHICAPTFIFLAGVSTYFVTQKRTLNDTSFFLLTRGVWLIILQLTLIRFAWNFDPLFHYNSNTIISTIGVCMIILSRLIYCRLRTIFIIGLLMVAGHNLLDGVSFEQGTIKDVIWSFLHVSKSFDLGNGYAFTFLYPIIPWSGVMALGYCFGVFFSPAYSSQLRKLVFLYLATICLLAFVTLRISNIYGDPVAWSKQGDTITTLMSFLNLQKYPPSLLYLLATLSITLLLLSAMEGKSLRRWKSITLFGNVAMFYYVAHIFLIHALAMLAAIAAGYPWQSMVFRGSVGKGNILLNGSYGFSLWVVYLIWMAVIVLLYPLCVYWNDFKIRNNKKWWVSYL
jgi:uncharacterized membrane protein